MNSEERFVLGQRIEEAGRQDHTSPSQPLKVKEVISGRIKEMRKRDRLIRKGIFLSFLGIGIDFSGIWVPLLFTPFMVLSGDQHGMAIVNYHGAGIGV